MVDSTADSNKYSLEYYQAQLTEYGYLVESIVSGQSMFPEEDMSECAMMYNDYVNALAEYTRSYESAYETYMYLLDNDSVTHDTDSMLTYETTMLEGYRYYLESVENDKDMFPKTGEVSYYRSLYEDYQAKCKELDQAVLSAQATHRSLVNASELAKENERKTKEAEQQADEQADALQDLRDAAAEAVARAAAAQVAAQAALDAVSGQGIPQTDPSNTEDTNPSGEENDPSDGDNLSPSDGDNDNLSESKADESSDAENAPNSSEGDNPPLSDLPERNDESPADSESDRR